MLRSDSQTDRLTRGRHADRRMLLLLLLLWTFLPIRSHKENDIIPVLTGQQEGGGRGVVCVRESMKEYEKTKGNTSVDQSYDYASGGVFDHRSARDFDVPHRNVYVQKHIFPTFLFSSC